MDLKVRQMGCLLFSPNQEIPFAFSSSLSDLWHPFRLFVPEGNCAETMTSIVRRENASFLRQFDKTVKVKQTLLQDDSFYKKRIACQSEVEQATYQ